MRLTVERKPVSKSLRRVRPGLWRGRLGARQVRLGVNHLVASARGRSGPLGYASSSFTVGKRRPGLLSLAALGERSSGFTTSLELKRPVRRLGARLNGRRLPWPSGYWPSRRALLRLGADDGLHFGRNRVRVFAAGADGAYDFERRTVVVPRTRPLAGAGRDRRTVAGTTLRIDGRRSRAARPGAKLRFHWQVVRAPRGSKRRLKGASGTRPRVRLDRPGTYEVRLTVTETGRGLRRPRRASDTATLRAVADVPPIGLPIETIVANGKTGSEADTAIRIGSTTYPLGAPKGNRVQAVILDRNTLEPLYSASFAGSKGDAETLAAKIAAIDAHPLVVIAAPDLGGPAPDPGFAKVAKSIGAATASIEGRSGWSAVGTAGSKAGAYLAAGGNPGTGTTSRGNLDGFLQRTVSLASGISGFAYVPATRVAYDTSVPGTAALHNTIRVGAAEYPSEPLSACAAGGIQIQVLQAETLAPVVGGTYTTNGCGAGPASAALAELVLLLGNIPTTGANEGPKLIFVQTIGIPFDAGSTGWNVLATELTKFGATPSVAAGAYRGYTLVGGVGIERLPLTESSQILTGAPARSAGLLVPDRRGAYVPMLASPTGETPYDLAEIAYQPPTP